MFAVTDQFEPAEGGGAGSRRPLLHHVRSGVFEIETGDRYHARLRFLAAEEGDELGGEGLEGRSLGIGPALFGDLARRTRDGAGGGLEELVHARGGPRAALELGDDPLDPFQDVGKGWEVVQRREPAEGLEGLRRLL